MSVTILRANALALPLADSSVDLVYQLSTLKGIGTYNERDDSAGGRATTSAG